MPITFNKLTVGLPCPFRLGNEEDRDILLCTMGRMVRNLPGHPFPGWSSSEDRAAVAAELLPVLKAMPELKGGFQSEMPKLTHMQRMVLLARKQITPSMAARQDGCHILISKDQDTIAMVNEEEHLCLHTYVSGLDGRGVLDRLSKMDACLSGELAFAASNSDGYLTSLPMEAGEGLQLYAVMHMPAMHRSDMMERVRKALEKLGLNITPFYMDAGEDVGSIFVIFTPAIRKGGTEEGLARFTRICKLLAEREESLQNKLTEDDGTAVEDAIFRAYGQLRYSRRMDFKEMISHLSLIRWGLKRGYFRNRNTCIGTYKGAELATLLALYVTESPAVLPFDNKVDAGDKMEIQFQRSVKCSVIMGGLEPVPASTPEF